MISSYYSTIPSLDNVIDKYNLSFLNVDILCYRGNIYPHESQKINTINFGVKGQYRGQEYTIKGVVMKKKLNKELKYRGVSY